MVACLNVTAVLGCWVTWSILWHVCSLARTIYSVRDLGCGLWTITWSLVWHVLFLARTRYDGPVVSAIWHGRTHVHISGTFRTTNLGCGGFSYIDPKVLLVFFFHTWISCYKRIIAIMWYPYREWLCKLKITKTIPQHSVDTRSPVLLPSCWRPQSVCYSTPEDACSALLYKGYFPARRYRGKETLAGYVAFFCPCRRQYLQDPRHSATMSRMKWQSGLETALSV